MLTCLVYSCIRFFYYYWINGQTLVGPQEDHTHYAGVKAVNWEGFMTQRPLQQLPTAFFSLNG